MSNTPHENAVALREMADFIATFGDDDYAGSHWVYLNAQSVAEMVARAKRLGGTWHKEANSYGYSLVRKFGPHRVIIEIPRSESCVRVQTGTQKVRKPDPNAPMVEVDEPIYEWLCLDSLLAKAADQ